MSIARRVALVGSLFLLTAGIAGACAVPAQPVGPLATTTTAAPTTTQAPLSIGSGSSSPQGFVDAYNRKGSSIMGSPIAAVEYWGTACMQRFSSPTYGENAIVQADCSGMAYGIIGEFWTYAKSEGPLVLGYPSMESHRWGNDTGWSQDFNGGFVGHAVLARGDAVRQVHGLWSGFLDWYYTHGDAGGYLQWPTSDDHNWCNGSRQDFQGGSIMWDANGGVRPATDCAPPPPPVPTREQRAGDWAISEKNSPDPTWSDQFGAPWSGLCEGFVEVANGTISKKATSDADYQERLGSGAIHSDTNAPYGVLVFYSGHVGISIGAGQVISTQGYGGQRLPVWQHPITGFLTNQYLGWAYAPSDWPGR